MSSNIKLTLSGNYYQYFNVINSSDLRNNELLNFNSSVEFNTSFDFPINFGNEFFYNYTESRFSGTINNFKTLTNNSKLIFKSKKGIVSSLSSSFFNPNIENNSNNINFLDFKLKYTPKNKNWNVNFVANNLLNNSFFETVEISDFSSSIFQNQLLGRIFMLSMEFSF